MNFVFFDDGQGKNYRTVFSKKILQLAPSVERPEKQNMHRH